MTNDLDIFFPRYPENLCRLVAALRPFHPRLRGLPIDLPFIWEEATLRNGTIFTLTTEVGDIDLLAEVSGLGSFDEVEAVSVTAEAFGRNVRTLDLRSLIKAKQDLRTLPELESLLEVEER